MTKLNSDFVSIRLILFLCVHLYGSSFMEHLILEKFETNPMLPNIMGNLFATVVYVTFQEKLAI